MLSESTNVGRLEIQNSCFADGPCNIPHHKDGFFEYTVNTGTVPDVLPVGEAVDYEIVFSPTDPLMKRPPKVPFWRFKRMIPTIRH